MADSDDHENYSPRTVGPERSLFDRFADKASAFLSEGPFFVACVVAYVAWLALAPFLEFSHGWVDLINTVVVLLTLLMVALLENEQRRGDQAVQRKLNAIADALADFMEKEDVDEDQVEELRSAIGIEQRESTGNTGERARETFSQSGKEEPVEEEVSSE